MDRRQLITLALGGCFVRAAAGTARAASPAKKPAAPAKIAWFGTWKEGLAEAKRTGRPILLIAATPHCHNISGLW